MPWEIIKQVVCSPARKSEAPQPIETDGVVAGLDVNTANETEVKLTSLFAPAATVAMSDSVTLHSDGWAPMTRVSGVMVRVVAAAAKRGFNTRKRKQKFVCFTFKKSKTFAKLY